MEVRIEKGRVKVGDRWASLLSGTVQYWRLHPASWKQILQSVKDMGLETIETYIPWEYHEIKPGVFDFTGETDTRRNLVGFLQLAKEMDLWLLIRPGPFIYSEWTNMGVPTDVARYHRMHPYFTSRAAVYIREVCKILAPFLATRAGNIIMFQPDNETDPFECCYEEQLGLGEKPGDFQLFLKEKYQDIEKLNSRWGADLKTFEEARPIMSRIDLDSDFFKRYLDFQEFRANYVTQCVDFYAKEYRKNGFDIPAYTNIYDIFSVQDPIGLNKVVDLVSVDAYPSNEFPDKTFISGDELGHRRLGEVFRHLRTHSETAYIAEYECGIAHGLHYTAGILTPNHFVMTNLTALQSGIHGLNWYMLVNRDNFMMSPITEWGRKQKELFQVFAEFVKIYKEIDVPALEKLTHTSLFFNMRHQLIKGASADPSSLAIYNAGIDYELFNPDTGRLNKPLMFYSGPNWLPVADQEKLARYVEEGGNLVFFQSLPIYDEEFHKANVLGLRKPERVPDEPFLDHLATETEVDLGGWKAYTRAPFYVYDGQLPGEPIYGERVDTDLRDTGYEDNLYLRSLVVGHRYRVGYREARGKGSITVLGVRPTPEFATAIHHFLKIPIPIYSHASTVKPALFKGKDEYYAVLINIGDYPVEAALDISSGLLNSVQYEARCLRGSIQVNDAELDRGRLYVSLPRKNGTVIAIRKK
jgi:beta-galactosidase